MKIVSDRSSLKSKGQKDNLIENVIAPLNSFVIVREYLQETQNDDKINNKTNQESIHSNATQTSKSSMNEEINDRDSLNKHDTTFEKEKVTETLLLEIPGPSSPPSLSLLNKCGSAPLLPLQSPMSSNVYTSKRQMTMKSRHHIGLNPQTLSLQHSRLRPLPATFQQFPTTDHTSPSDSMDSNSMKHTRDSCGTFEEYTSLRKRVIHLEHELSKVLKLNTHLQQQLTQLRNSKKTILEEKILLTHKADDLEHLLKKQAQMFDKLSKRYNSMYSNIENVAPQSHNYNSSTTPSSEASAINSAVSTHKTKNPSLVIHKLIQTLTKENLECQRKLRVLEVQHTEDKTRIQHQTAKLKRLEAELETAQTQSQQLQTVNENLNPMGTSPSHSTVEVSSNEGKSFEHSSISSPVIKRVVGKGATTNQGGNVLVARYSRDIMYPLKQKLTENGHMVNSQDWQYIDPNILQVLDKVDPQFSMANTINLSVALKKWLHSCLNVINSTDILSVLQSLLSQACILLQCEHVTVFKIDYSAQKVRAICSEKGSVDWDMPLHKGLVGFSAINNITLNIKKASEDPRFYSASNILSGTKAHQLLCIPISQCLSPSSSTCHDTQNQQSVFLVLQAKNTQNNKPFTINDQIIGGLIAIQAGIIYLQTKLVTNLQCVNNKIVKLFALQDEIASRVKLNKMTIERTCSTDKLKELSINDRKFPVLRINVVDVAQQFLADLIGTRNVRIFVHDNSLHKVWYVEYIEDNEGRKIPSPSYANIGSSLCSLVQSNDGQTNRKTISSGGLVVADPIKETLYNDMVDLAGSSNGLYIMPILSIYEQELLGVVQVARFDPSILQQFHSDIRIETNEMNRSIATPQCSNNDDKVLTALQDAIAAEKYAELVEVDKLRMELIAHFCKQFSSILHYMTTYSTAVS